MPEDKKVGWTDDEYGDFREVKTVEVEEVITGFTWKDGSKTEVAVRLGDSPYAG
jgi:hypothetical protein